MLSKTFIILVLNINQPFHWIFFLANGKCELLPQEAISEITIWCCSIRLMVQPDPSYIHFSTLNENWLC